MKKHAAIASILLFATVTCGCSLFGNKANNATNEMIRASGQSHASLTPNFAEMNRENKVEMERARSEALLHNTVESGSTKGLHKNDVERLQGHNWVLKTFELSDQDVVNEMAKNKVIAEGLGDTPSTIELFRAEAYYVYLLAHDFKDGKKLGIPSYLRIRDELKSLAKKFEKMHEYDESRYGNNSIAGFWSGGNWVEIPPEVYTNRFAVYEESDEYKKARAEIDEIEAIHPSTATAGNGYKLNPTDDNAYLAREWASAGYHYKVSDEYDHGLYFFIDELNKLLDYEVPQRGGSNIDETYKKLTQNCNGDKYCEAHYLRGILKAREEWYLETKPRGFKVNTIVDGICQGRLSDITILPKDDAEIYTNELKAYYDAIDDVYKKANDGTPRGSYEFNWGNGVRSAAEITEAKKAAVASIAEKTKLSMPSNTKDSSIEKYIKNYLAQYTKAKILKITVEHPQWIDEIDQSTVDKRPKGHFKEIYYFVEDPENKGTILMGPKLLVVENYDAKTKKYGDRRVDIHGVYRKINTEALNDLGNRCIYRIVTDYKK